MVIAMVEYKTDDPVARALQSAFAGETVLAAVSGGPDSMAMFHALCTLARARGNLGVIAANFDHRLRKNSHLDRDPVEKVAARFGVRVVCGDGDAAGHARSTRQSIEAAAREMRYAFLERAAREVNADTIATAHTHSDHIETVLMRILRGTGMRGMRGIPVRRGLVARPLLAVTRAETLHYCETHNVPFVTDPSNADLRFFRNRVRHDVLPSLRRVYPGIDATLERLSRNAESSWSANEPLGSPMRAEGDDIWSLHIGALDGLDDEQRIRLLSDALDSIGLREDVGRVHYRALLRLANDTTPGASADLPRLRVRREHDALVFTRRVPARKIATTSHVLTVPGTATIGDWTLTSNRLSGHDARKARETQHERVAPRREPGGLAPPRVARRQAPRVREECVAFLPAGAPLTIRFPRPGDRMQPFGMKGHKKLSDLFIDMKIPRRMRVETPVIESNGEIVWVVGVAASESTRMNDRANAVRLTATRDRGDR
jgi:tRNA(Ile)-lysidine synthase